jgi:hypothetical protein
MSDIFHSVSFLGWHRHKNGWLEPARATYLQTTSTWYGTFSPLSGGCGLSMVVLSVDRARHPSKVFVIEVAQPVLGTDEQYRGEGILVYTVDATVATLSSPVVVIPKTLSASPVYGALFEAPYGVGDHISVHDRNASLDVTVLRKFGSSYNIKSSTADRPHGSTACSTSYSMLWPRSCDSFRSCAVSWLLAVPGPLLDHLSRSAATDDPPPLWFCRPISPPSALWRDAAQMSHTASIIGLPYRAGSRNAIHWPSDSTQAR